MSINTDFNLHRAIVNSLLRINIDNRLNLAAFRNMIIEEIERLEQRLSQISIENTFRYRIEVRLNLLKTIENWLKHSLVAPRL